MAQYRSRILLLMLTLERLLGLFAREDQAIPSPPSDNSDRTVNTGDTSTSHEEGKEGDTEQLTENQTQNQNINQKLWGNFVALS